MKTIVLASVILFSGVMGVCGSSLVNPWHEVKVSLQVEKGETAGRALRVLIDAAKEGDRLQYELYFSKSRLEPGGVDTTVPDAGLSFRGREIGMALSDLARSLKCGLILSEDVIGLVPVKTADVRYDLFYLIPESLKSSERTEAGLRGLIEARVPGTRGKGTITFDVKLRMILLRADRSTHEEIGKLLETG